jgi:hypothetical protein
MRLLNLKCLLYKSHAEKFGSKNEKKIIEDVHLISPLLIFGFCVLSDVGVESVVYPE